MKTMFRTEIGFNYDGLNDTWKANTEWVTKEEAMNATKDVTHEFPMTGDWRIIARTIDEATFTVTDEIIVAYNWWEEIGRKNAAKHSLEIWGKEIEKAKAIKAHTEKGEIKKMKAIKKALEQYEYYKKIVEG